MNLFILKNRISAQLFAVFTMSAMLLSMLPVQAFIAEAATGPNLTVELMPKPATGDNDEYFVVKYFGDAQIDITGWNVTDEGGNIDYTFGSQVLTDGDSMKVCDQSNTLSDCDDVWGGSGQWNDGGDTLTLKNSLGDVVLTVTYTSAVVDQLETDNVATQKTLDGKDHVNICHSAKGKNYVANAPNLDAFVNLYISDDKNGHHGHDYDIIPPFFYSTKDDEGYYPGKNWTRENMAILENGCADPDGYYGFIALEKEVIGEEDPDLAQFDLMIEDTAYEHGDVVPVETKKNGATEYTVSEANIPSGYNLVGISCVGPKDKVATGSTSVLLEVKDEEEYLCTITNEKEDVPDQKISPILECVENLGDDGYRAHFGYENHNEQDVEILVGDANKMTGGGLSGQDQGQTTLFEYPAPNYPAPDRMGRTGFYPDNAFAVDFDGTNLVWTLTGPDGNTRTSTASADSKECPVIEPPVCDYGYGPENLLTNGSFEEPEVTDNGGTWQLFASIPGWVAETVADALSSDIELQRGLFGGASDGAQHVELDVDEPVKITQPVTTIPGATYELRFDFSARDGSGTENNAVEATADGTVVLATSTANTDWVTYTATFEATDTSTDIAFADITGQADGAGSLLDNARLCQIADPVQTCEVEIVSDTTDYVVEKDDTAKALSFIHDAWDAVIAGATWIWGDDPVVDPANEETQTFVKQFGFEGNVTKATLYVASDNSHDADLNGSDAGTAPEENNHALATQDEYDVTGLINQGNNELEIAVSNWAGNADPEKNPAGLMYKLHIEAEVTGDEDCVIPYEEETGMLTIVKDAGETGTQTPFTFDGEVGSFTLLGGESKNFELETGSYEIYEADLPQNWSLADVQCTGTQWEFSNNMLLVSIYDDTEAECTFVNEYSEPLVCEPDVNLIKNGGFELPVVTDDAGWDIFDLTTYPELEWLVEFTDTFAGAPAEALLEIHRDVDGWLPSEGLQYAELDADWEGPGGDSGEEASVAISQTIDTIPGEQYTLSWDYSPRPDTLQPENDLEVFVSGFGQVGNNTSAGGATTEWTSHSYTFIADSDETTVTFADDGDPNAEGTFVDNIALVCEPESEIRNYCGDGINGGEVVDGIQDWEQCDGEEGCTEYCLWDNQCHYEKLVKITLDPQAPASESFDGIFLGSATNPIPSGTWFSFDEVDTNTAQSIAKDSDGLGVERTGTELRLAVEGGNTSNEFDYAFGTIEVLGLDMGAVDRNPVVGWPLEDTGSYIDIFDKNANMIEFEWYLTSGDDAAAVELTETPDPYGYCPGPEYLIEGHKWNDSDGNGVWDTDEDGIGGWTIYATQGSTTLETTTNDDGYYSFLVGEGDWEVTEEEPAGWTQTYADECLFSFGEQELQDTFFSRTLAFVSDVISDESDYCDFGNYEEQSSSRSSSGGGGSTRPVCEDLNLSEDDGIYTLSWETRRGNEIVITQNGTEILTTTDDDGEILVTTPEAEYELTVSRGSRTDTCLIEAAPAGRVLGASNDQVRVIPLGAADAGAGGAASSTLYLTSFLFGYAVRVTKDVK